MRVSRSARGRGREGGKSVNPYLRNRKSLRPPQRPYKVASAAVCSTHPTASLSISHMRAPMSPQACRVRLNLSPAAVTAAPLFIKPSYKRQLLSLRGGEAPLCCCHIHEAESERGGALGFCSEALRLLPIPPVTVCDLALQHQRFRLGAGASSIFSSAALPLLKHLGQHHGKLS
jgi:hypothetical protein